MGWTVPSWFAGSKKNCQKINENGPYLEEPSHLVSTVVSNHGDVSKSPKWGWVVPLTHGLSMAYKLGGDPNLLSGVILQVNHTWPRCGWKKIVETEA